LSSFRKYALIAIASLVVNTVSMAQPFSYIYIQGDKSTPFYVKMDGQMMPRYGKDYCILSELNAGLVHITVLFQQNVFPAQNFEIRVPENGYREFLLNKTGKEFGLYDLQTKNYLDTNQERNLKN
jgi:hypothetical protein